MKKNKLGTPNVAAPKPYLSQNTNGKSSKVQIRRRNQRITKIRHGIGVRQTNHHLNINRITSETCHKTKPASKERVEHFYNYRAKAPVMATSASHLEPERNAN